MGRLLSLVSSLLGSIAYWLLDLLTFSPRNSPAPVLPLALRPEHRRAVGPQGLVPKMQGARPLLVPAHQRAAERARRRRKPAECAGCLLGKRRCPTKLAPRWLVSESPRKEVSSRLLDERCGEEERCFTNMYSFYKDSVHFVPFTHCWVFESPVSRPNLSARRVALVDLTYNTTSSNVAPSRS